MNSNYFYLPKTKHLRGYPLYATPEILGTVDQNQLLDYVVTKWAYQNQSGDPNWSEQY